MVDLEGLPMIRRRLAAWWWRRLTAGADPPPGIRPDPPSGQGRHP